MDREKGIHKISQVVVPNLQLSEEMLTKISPTDLGEFLPWACLQLGFNFTPRVVKAEQAHMMKIHSKQRKTGKSTVGGIEGDKSTYNREEKSAYFKEEKSEYFKEEKSTHYKSDESEYTEDSVKVVATYDATDLVHLQFEKTKHLPRQLLTLFALIAEFFPLLYGITLKCGIDQYTSYELRKILSKSNITELILDDTFIEEANYSLLLEDGCNLQVLSLARCKMGDNVAQDIASKLRYPLPASTKLCALNLSSNYLTDKSAKSFADMLRTNRKLCYLKLAGNLITDDGGIEILKVFLPFPLTQKEIYNYYFRYMNYLKGKEDAIKKILAEIKLVDLKKKDGPKKYNKATPQKKGDDVLHNQLTDAMLYEKAVETVQKTYNAFEDPLLASFIIDEQRYCSGNTKLAYLSLAYNDLSLLFLKWLVNVMQYQHTEWKGKYMLNVRVDGNPMPETCKELNDIDMLLSNALTTLTKRGSAIVFKKHVSKK